MTDSVEEITNNDPAGIGHQKAVACAVVGPIVTIGSYITSLKYGLELPGHIVEALVTFFSTLAVWLTPAHKAPKI